MSLPKKLSQTALSGEQALRDIDQTRLALATLDCFSIKKDGDIEGNLTTIASVGILVVVQDCVTECGCKMIIGSIVSAG